MYTSLEIHKYVESGWLQTVYHRKTDVGHILRAKVMSSQATSDKPHQAWATVRLDGSR